MHDSNTDVDEMIDFLIVCESITGDIEGFTSKLL